MAFILDGNNRMCFIQSLFDDTYTIPEGKYEYITDELNGTIASFIVRKGKQKFSDLPERVREIVPVALVGKAENGAHAIR